MRVTRRMKINETAAWLKSRDKFLVITHRRPDGDTLGCAAALCQALSEQGKAAYMYRNEDTTSRYIPYVEKHWAPAGFTPDFVITVDIATTELFPEGAAQYKDAIDLGIDHHPSNTGYAKELCIDATCAACGEIVYEILLEMAGSISADSATSLYIALATDTGCFSFGNTTANTFRVAAELVDAGAPLGPLNRWFFNMKTRSRITIEGMITSSLEFSHGGRACIVAVTDEMMARAGATNNDMDDIAAIPCSVEGVQIGFTIRELDGGGCKVSVRSTTAVDSCAFSARFGGGGHKMASGFTLPETVGAIKARILSALDEIFPEVG